MDWSLSNYDARTEMEVANRRDAKEKSLHAHIAALEAELREHCQVEADELAGIDARLSGEPRDATRTPAWLIGWDGQDVDMAMCARIAALEVQLAAAEERGAREYERGVVDAFGFLWRGVGRRDFAVKKFLQEQAGITACADDAGTTKSTPISSSLVVEDAGRMLADVRAWVAERPMEGMAYQLTGLRAVLAAADGKNE